MPRRSRGETEPRLVVVVDPKDLLTRKSDRVVIGIAALDPRRLEDVEFICRRGILGYKWFQEHVVTHNSMCVCRARTQRKRNHQRENYCPPHKHPPRPPLAVSSARNPLRLASHHLSATMWKVPR